ncbi:MAG: signal peptidase II [Myxococcota bacterium]
MSRKLVWFAVVLPTLFGFDFWTKELARDLPVGGEVEVAKTALVNLSWFHAENPDIAFSMPVPMSIVIPFGFLALAVLAHTLWSMRPDAGLQAVAVASIAAGALGNLVDRLVDGSVTDMVRLSTDHPELAPWLTRQLGTTTWPIFNVADVAVLAGVVLFLASQAFADEDHEPELTVDGPPQG